MQKVGKTTFTKESLKSDPSPKKISKPKVKCIVTSNEKLKNHVKLFSSQKK
jgi:hypothetical protein